MKLYVLLITLVLGLSFGKPPTPFGLELGKTTEKEFLKVVKQKGWNIEKSGYKIIKPNISNSDVIGYVISDINIEKFKAATFWFYKGTLFQIVYYLDEDLQDNTFNLYFDQLNSKYGKPASYKKGEEAIWKFNNVVLSLDSTSKARGAFLLFCSGLTSFENCAKMVQRVPLEVRITYTHTILSKKAEKSDKYYYRKYMKKKSKETEGL